MKRRKFSYSGRLDRETSPFASAAEAWFWGMQCFVARAEGARFRADMAETARPCEPDDLLVAVERLARRGTIGPAHVRTLFTFGRRLAPPDERQPAEQRAARLWNEALDRLTGPWREKGIVA